MSQNDKNNSILKIGLNLTITCLISGIIISGVFIITEPIAKRERENIKMQALKELVNYADCFKKINNKTDWSKAIKNEKIIAYIVPTEIKGYGGTIKIITAVTPEKKVLGYKILMHNETPGLGDKVCESKFQKQFFGKNFNDLEVVKIPSERNIQALTGATISSKAVTLGVKKAIEEVNEYMES